MNTVQKNNTITRKQVQELLEENQEKLGLSDKNLEKLVKSMRSHTISRQMRKVFYQECLKKIERNEEEKTGKFKHLRISFTSLTHIHKCYPFAADTIVKS